MPITLITGIQAAGKSTVAQALAERLPRSVHVRGDVFRRMIVNGRVEMGPADPPAEAVRQLRLRYALAAAAADGYAEAGFQVVFQDIVLGDDLPWVVDRIRTRPLSVVVLAPRAEVVAARDAERRRTRGKVAYRPGDQAVAALDDALRAATPRLGLWIDTSDLTVAETVDRILAGTDSAAVA
ncbi:AAA family ATPase [Micromonospora globbae]|uniref:AAA family ATPase n=1 Tax=Micromonospora globbae TaxID=1894969 RepID=UPI003432042C